MKHYIMSWFLIEFHQNNVLPKGCNSSFITLIRKIESPQGLGVYFPISLVGFMFKVLSKILANRLESITIDKVPSWKVDTS